MFGIGLVVVFANSVWIFFRELTHAVDETKSPNKCGFWAMCLIARRGLPMVIA